jgi:hypothetical protein
MGTILWILQAILCIKFISVAFTHGFGRGNTEMQQAKQKLGRAAQPLLPLAALGMFLGGLARFCRWLGWSWPGSYPGGRLSLP